MKNKEIKAIVFDIGGVLIEEVGFKVSKIICEKFNIDQEEFRELRKRYYKKSSTGKLSESQYDKEICDELNLSKEKRNSFIKLWKRLLDKYTIVNKKIKSLLIGLRKNYLLVALTNVSPLYEGVRKRKGIYKYFNIKLTSVHTGLRKPHINFYRLLIKKTKLLPREMVFIDDVEKYLVPAKKLGINVIHFKNNNQLIRDLKKLGVEV